MNVVCLLGSPRSKGNSTWMAKQLLDKMKNKKAFKSKIYSLSKLKYRGCIACYSCKTKRQECSLKDDLSQVLKDVKECDLLIMSSPTYYGEVSSQLKAFIDRTFSYLNPDYTSNPYSSRLSGEKKLVFILAQGHPDEQFFKDIFPRYDFFFKWYGFKESYLIRACGVYNIGDVEKRKDIIDLIDETASLVLDSKK
ncbi:MAG: flavodoxin family protein [Thermodesulfovibrionales bacterium]|nr:flavodoxin family protein [Thermodesulfovibrionales bacterium]